MKENKSLEFKGQMSDSFLKTVSAYANYGTGIIQFGVNDEGKEIGVEMAEALNILKWNRHIGVKYE